MSPHQERPYPFAPLDAVIGDGDACRMLAVSATTLRRYREFGLTEQQADRLAVRAGFHAASLWPEVVDRAIAAAETVCERSDCANRFIPTRKGHRFCSPHCRQMVSVRARRKTFGERRNRLIHCRLHL